MENASQQKPSGKRPAKIWAICGWAAAVIVLFIIYLRICDMQIVGFLHDDGVYALTAKALAEGQGYRLLNLPLPDGSGFTWQVKYPIGYPLLLSLGWLFQPKFPQNLPWLHVITVFFAVIAIPLLYRYLRTAKHAGRWLAGLICLLVATNFQYLYFSSAIMSEAPYFFWSLLALFWSEKNTEPPSRKRMIVMVAASALAFHTRTIGLALIVAISLGLALRKQWRSALIYGGSSALLTVIPWAIWVKTHAMSLTPLTYPLAYVYGGYGIEFNVNASRWLLNLGQAFLNEGLLPVLHSPLGLMFPQLPYFFRQNLLASELFTLILVGLLLLGLIRGVRNREFSVSGLYLGFYMSALALWMYPNQTLRFMAVVLPWLWLYFFRAGRLLLNAIPFRPVASGLHPAIAPVAAGILSLWLIWPGLPGYQLLYRLRTQHLLEPTGRTQALWPDYQATFAYFNQSTNITERIASVWDPVFYLYTGHPTMGMFISSLRPVNGQFTPQSFQELRASFIHYGVKYIVVEPFLVNQKLQAPENPVATTLLEQFPQDFTLEYISPHRMLRVYRFSPSR